MEITNRQEQQDKRKLGDSMLKFGAALKELAEKTGSQTKILTSMLSTQVKEAYERRRQERIASVQQNDEDKKKDSYFVKAQEGLGRMTGTDGSLKGMTGWLLDKAITGITLAAIGPIVVESAQNLVEAALKEMGVSKGLSKSIADNVGSSVAWGMFGRIFGKKFAVVFGVGSYLWNALESRLDLENHLEDFLAPMVGPKLAENIGNSLGVVLSAGLLLMVPKLIRGSISLAVSTILKTGMGILSVAEAITPILRSSLFTAMKAGLGLAMRALPIAAAAGIATLYYKYGESAAEWLSEMTGAPVEWTNQAVRGASYVAAGATLGLMFGPTGSVVGAIVGLVAALGHSIWDWFSARREEAVRRAEEEKKKLDAKIKKLDTSVSPETGKVDTISRMTDVNKNIDGSTTFSATKKIGEEYDPMSIITPSINTERTDRRNIELSANAMASSVRSLIDGYDGSQESQDRVIQALHAMYAMRQEIDEKREANGGFWTPETRDMNNALKNAGNDLWKFAKETIPEYFNENFEGLPRFRTGTKGFVDFGPQSVALLHGREAVVPENTDAAHFLKQYFNDDWSKKNELIRNATNMNNRLSMLKQQKDPGTSGSVVIAPTTIAPRNTYVGGSRVNNSRITSIGTGGSDLDFGLPKGAL